MGKVVIFCADGTWNGPDQDDDNDGSPDFTNVYKLFIGLDGELSADTLLNAGEQEKSLIAAGRPIQVAKYIHGVGDSKNPIRKLMGGAFGAGIIARRAHSMARRAEKSNPPKRCTNLLLTSTTVPLQRPNAISRGSHS